MFRSLLRPRRRTAVLLVALLALVLWAAGPRPPAADPERRAPFRLPDPPRAPPRLAPVPTRGAPEPPQAAAAAEPSRAAPLVGTVVDAASGAPVAGAEVLLRRLPPGTTVAPAEPPEAAWVRLAPGLWRATAPGPLLAPPERTATDAEGRFVFEPPGHTRSEAGAWAGELCARHPDHYPAALWFVGPGTPRLVLRPRPRLRLRLLDRAGAALADRPLCVECAERYRPGDLAPIGWAALQPGPQGRPGPAVLLTQTRHGDEQRLLLRVHARTDAAGRLDLALPQTGDVRVSVFEPGGGAFLEEVTLREGDGDLDLGTRTLGGPTAGHLRLTDRAGRPCAGLRLGLTLADAWQTPVPGPGPAGVFEADAAGRLALAGLPRDSALWLWPHVPGAPPAPVRLAPAQIEDGALVVLDLTRDR